MYLPPSESLRRIEGRCRGQRTRAPGGLSHPSNDDDSLHAWMDGNGLKSNRQSAHFGDCVVSVSKIISKKIPARLLFRPKKYSKKYKKIKKIK